MDQCAPSVGLLVFSACLAPACSSPPGLLPTCLTFPSLVQYPFGGLPHFPEAYPILLSGNAQSDSAAGDTVTVLASSTEVGGWLGCVGRLLCCWQAAGQQAGRPSAFS